MRVKSAHPNPYGLWRQVNLDFDGRDGGFADCIGTWNRTVPLQAFGILACAFVLFFTNVKKLPGYDYDYSHAWGATPAYQLMSKITGLQMIKPGFCKILLKPDLFGLKSAKVNIPLPYGMIRCDFGKENKIEVPDITFFICTWKWILKGYKI